MKKIFIALLISPLAMATVTYNNIDPYNVNNELFNAIPTHADLLESNYKIQADVNDFIKNPTQDKLADLIRNFSKHQELRLMYRNDLNNYYNKTVSLISDTAHTLSSNDPYAQLFSMDYQNQEINNLVQNFKRQVNYS